MYGVDGCTAARGLSNRMDVQREAFPQPDAASSLSGEASSPSDAWFSPSDAWFSPSDAWFSPSDESSSPSDEASASIPTPPCARGACGGGRDSGGRAPESAPPNSCSVKSSRASTEWSRRARSATSAFIASTSRGSMRSNRCCGGGDIFLTTHWQRSIPVAPIAPPPTKVARTTMMISTSIRTLRGCVKPATLTAGGSPEERDRAPHSPLPTRIRTFGFRGPTLGENPSTFGSCHGSITVPDLAALTVRSPFLLRRPPSLGCLRASR